MDLERLPFMLYADDEGKIYEHPYLRMAAFSGDKPVELDESDLISMPEFSKLFFLPKCPPIGVDPESGELVRIEEEDVSGKKVRCNAVSAFLEPGFVRTHLPAADYGEKDYDLPMWAYTAVGFRDDSYRVAGFQIEYNHTWDPANYDDRELITAIDRFRDEYGAGPLTKHLINCATVNHCFAAKNLFLRRWEAPLPVSQSCNAGCLGCLSLQPEGSFEASHARLAFRPGREELVSIALNHLKNAPNPIVSFGQGCEGEPLTEHALIVESISDMRKGTDKGTINLNTNGSLPGMVKKIISSGLDSIRISLNSPRKSLYDAYYRPKGYGFDDVVESVRLSRDMGIYTMINYLVFPGISDQEKELEALLALVEKTGVNFIHLKNLNIDPAFYLESMPCSEQPGMGMKKMISILKDACPDLELGYFNQPVR